jgi:hypothetical protein
MLGVNAESYRMLAYRLAENGIASYRYDKRYIGESNAFKKASMLATVEDFANDALACINALKANKNFDQVFVIGHSEGALLGAIVAGKEPISGYISLCGAGEPLDKVIESQIKTVMPDSYAEALVLIGDVKKSPVLPTKISEPLRSIFNDNNVVFIHSLFKYTPTSLVKAIKVPVLIVAGTNDLQIRQNDAHILNKANLKSKLVIIDSMNHVLKNAGKDVAENLKTYEDASLPINDILIQELTLFINEQRKEKKQ